MSQAPTAEPRRDVPNSAEPSVRPLGYLALGFGVVSILLAPTLFFSLLALPPGLLALGLGWAARSEKSTRKMGTAAVALGLVAVLCATTLLALVLTEGQGG